MNDDEVIDSTDEQALDAATHETARKHYEALFDLYAMPGWGLFMAEIQTQIDTLQDARKATRDNIDTVKGVLMTLDVIRQHEEMNRRAYDMMFAPAQIH